MPFLFTPNQLKAFKENYQHEFNEMYNHINAYINYICIQSKGMLRMGGIQDSEFVETLYLIIVNDFTKDKNNCDLKSISQIQCNDYSHERLNCLISYSAPLMTQFLKHSNSRRTQQMVIGIALLMLCIGAFALGFIFPPFAAAIISSTLLQTVFYATTISTGIAGPILITIGTNTYEKTFIHTFFSKATALYNREKTAISLKKFIEEPSQNLRTDALQKGVKEIVQLLKEDSAQIVSIIVNSDSIRTYLLHDLAVKMGKCQCLEQFSLLYDAHMDELLNTCVWGWHDLKRFIDNQPSYLERIMQRVCMSDDCIQRLLKDEKNAEDMMHQIKASNPHYEFPEQLSLSTPGSGLRVR